MNADKTIEEIRKTVLAYCEGVCPNIGDGHKETVNSGTIIHSKDRAWSWLDGLGSRIYINDNMSRATATAMYAILGLEARDAVEAYKASLQSDLKSMTAIVSSVKKGEQPDYVHVSKLAELQVRNTALVAALEEIGAFATDEDGEEMDAFDMGQTIGEMVDDAIAANKNALAANTEKGGVQG